VPAQRPRPRLQFQPVPGPASLDRSLRPPAITLWLQLAPASPIPNSLAGSDAPSRLQGRSTATTSMTVRCLAMVRSGSCAPFGPEHRHRQRRTWCGDWMTHTCSGRSRSLLRATLRVRDKPAVGRSNRFMLRSRGRCHIRVAVGHRPGLSGRGLGELRAPGEKSPASTHSSHDDT
jgi:hypothetical protein